MAAFLYERMTERQPKCKGTLAEPNGTPEPRFALQSTVNWMRGLAILVADTSLDWSSMQSFYKKVARNPGLSEAAVNTVFEQLLMGLHHLSALQAMAQAGCDRDLARVAIMAWYYGVYCAASAMIAAKDGSQQQEHMSTATQWDRQIAACALLPRPFQYRLTTLVKKDADIELAALRGTTTFVLPNAPTAPDEAHGVCVSYLSGTREYREWQIKEELKAKDLSKLGLSDFRSSKAKQLRDDRLRGKSLGFLHQAFRYRGKANYRDALFLTYEPQLGTVLKGFIPDMKAVLHAFVTISGAFCARRVPTADWRAFVEDLKGHIDLGVMPDGVWD